MPSPEAEGALPAPDQFSQLANSHAVADAESNSHSTSHGGIAGAALTQEAGTPDTQAQIACAVQPAAGGNDRYTAGASLQIGFDHAVGLMAGGNQAGAIAAFRHILGFAPWLVEAHINLGLLLSDGPALAISKAMLLEAEAHYRIALELDATRLDGYLHLGVLLAAQKRFDEAEALYRLALAMAPDSVAALSNLGVLLACTGREDQASACYRAALAIDPSYDNAHFNLAYLLLRRGHFSEGWQALEHRPWYARFDACFDFPRWTGESLHGKTLLIGIEAGNGDMIQFCRYAALAKRAGASRVGIVCHPGLTRLLRTVPDIDSVFGIDAALPTSGWDYWTPPLSMPHYFGTRIDSIPDALPYLKAAPEVMDRMQAILALHETGEQAEAAGTVHGRRLRVGLVWQGNPRFENDGDRSLPSLATLAPLAEIGTIGFYSLQKGPGALAQLAARVSLPVAVVPQAASASASASVRVARQAPPDHHASEARTAGADDHGVRPAASPIRPPVAAPSFPGLVDLAPCIDDFADTAGLIAQLDLVISVDTAVAHLAGALGKPCWVLLPAFKTDWRWLTDRDDSPWYPGVMRLFRQSAAGGWTEVISRVRDALLALER
jgi:tetratricopeptide (TPR) repeat protein